MKIVFKTKEGKAEFQREENLNVVVENGFFFVKVAETNETIGAVAMSCVIVFEIYKNNE